MAAPGEYFVYQSAHVYVVGRLHSFEVVTWGITIMSDCWAYRDAYPALRWVYVHEKTAWNTPRSCVTLGPEAALTIAVLSAAETNPLRLL